MNRTHNGYVQSFINILFWGGLCSSSDLMFLRRTDTIFYLILFEQINTKHKNFIANSQFKSNKYIKETWLGIKHKNVKKSMNLG